MTRRSCLFGVYSLCLVLGSLPVLRALFDFSRSDSSASHLVLIPFITLALVYEERKRIFSSVRVAWLPGAVVLSAGLGVALAAALAGSAADEQTSLSLSAAGFVMLWIGGFVLFFGPSAAQAAGFPLFFLLFMIPIPAPVLSGAISLLKHGSADAVAGLFAIIGMPYHREGFVFALSTVTIEIADACSGIRSSIALFLSALLAGHRTLRRGWSRTVLVLAILPVTIAKNAIRIVALSWLAINVNPAFLKGRLHTDGGVVFFALALALLIPILIVLRRIERGRSLARPALPAAPRERVIS